ncbi:ribonuclease P protein component [Parapedobacter sp. ISTM3]|uniref:Ribonuclease P protein component n=1 Tax=Parapedobacter luteus TaxID=623280 RepID=A0A1T5E1V6_9SPHI|nr:MULTISPECIES: ribonuclease P protein component [Parapedobacter]MBK1441016.1 ribonuclease P protein component [Parapedobacter sp. ISTM3]SKB77786.1 ribonuclease P protein component [Parapedobacter luteus]
MKTYQFPKEERLCSKRLIDSLFHNGSSFFIYPYRVVFIRVTGLAPKVQVVLSVSKRRFSRAVHRNLLKRRMREAYRLQKGQLLYPSLEKQPYGLAVAIQYVGKTLLDYPMMHVRMADALAKLRDAHLSEGNIPDSHERG